jgi:transposase
VRRIEREGGVVHADDAAAHRERNIGRPSKAAPYAETIRKWLEADPALPTLELLHRARSEGYAGHKSAFYALVAALRPPRTAPIVRFEGLPGEFSQHDFGQVDVRFIDGQVKRIHFFASRLKFSRFAQVSIVRDEKTETLIRTLVRHFVGFGGVPLLAVFDRPRTIVQKGGKGRHVEAFNATFAQAMLDLGVGIEMCAPRSGNQKGSVERLVGWVKGSFFKVRRFLDEADLESQLATWAPSRRASSQNRYSSSERVSA